MHGTALLFCDFPISVGQPWDSRGSHRTVPPPARYLGSDVQRDSSMGGSRLPHVLSGWRSPPHAVPGTCTAHGCHAAPTARHRGTNRRNRIVPVTASDRYRQTQSEHSPTPSKQHGQPTPWFCSNQPERSMPTEVKISPPRQRSHKCPNTILGGKRSPWNLHPNGAARESGRRRHVEGLPAPGTLIAPGAEQRSPELLRHPRSRH